ncbi:MAG TPA: PQQ-binding-like beta-propeller repeat protein, partial [Vicinamibacteria bacterium]
MKKAPRLWPAGLIVVLYLALLGHVWWVSEAIRQERMLRTLIGGVVTALLLLLWLAFFSRLSGRLRLGVIGAVLGGVALLVANFRIRGVSGDLLPILDSRWAKPQPPPLPKTAPVDTVASPPTAPSGQTSPASASGLPDSGSPPAAGPDAAAGVAPTGTRPAGEGKPKEDLTAPGPPWPQFLGPNRDATVPGLRLARDWTARPPKLVWRQPIGAAWSAFVIVDGFAITQEQRGDEELVVAYELATGRPRWSHSDKTRYDTVIAGVGPRATPTVADGRVFAQGATGILNALELRTGRKLWSRQVVAENGGREPTWGQAPSPLVLEGRVIVSAGGTEGRSLVAYDAASGEPVWAGGHDAGSYSSPQLVTLAGRPQVVLLGGASVAGYEPATGTLLWEHPWPGEQPNVAQPLPLPADRLLVSAGYGVGSKVIALAADGTSALRPSLVWETPRLKSKFANMVFHEGFVYGLDDGV